MMFVVLDYYISIVEVRMKVLRVSLILVLLMGIVISAQLYDKSLVLPGPGADYTALAAVDSLTCYLAISDGIVIKTDDGGLSYSTVFAAPTARTINRIRFLNAKFGVFICSDGTAFKTEDEGKTWQDISNTQKQPKALYDVYIISETEFWVVGANIGTNDPATIMKTTNGGTTYTFVTNPGAKKTAYAITFTTNNQNGIIGYSDGVMVSMDAGVTWVNPAGIDYGGIAYTRKDIRALCKIGDNTVIATGWGSFAAGFQNTILLISYDGGSTWANQVQTGANLTYCYGYDMYFENETVGYLACGGSGYGGLLMKTTNGGITWKPLKTVSGSLNAITKMGSRMIIAGDADNLWISVDDTTFIPVFYPQTRLNAVTTYRTNSFYAVGDNGHYVMSADNGATIVFGQAVTGTNASTMTGVTYDATNRVVWGAGVQFVRKTSKDNGITWEDNSPVQFNAKSYLEFIDFSDPTTVYCGGCLGDTKNDILLKSATGGTTWDTVMQKQIGVRWYSFASNSRIKVIGGGKGNVMIEDPGSLIPSWKSVTKPTTDTTLNIEDIALQNNRIWVCGGKALLSYSDDKGITWKGISLPLPVDTAGKAIEETIASLAISGASIYALEQNYGAKDFLFTSNDSGVTWSIDSIDVMQLNDMAIMGHNLVLVGYDGVIIIRSLSTDVEEKIQMVPHPVALTNYPNPFNPVTTIAFNLDRPAQINLEIFNAIGQKMETLIDNHVMPAGKHQVQWNATAYSTGIYYYRLKIDRTQTSQKMTLIK